MQPIDAKEVYSGKLLKNLNYSTIFIQPIDAKEVFSSKLLMKCMRKTKWSCESSDNFEIALIQIAAESFASANRKEFANAYYPILKIVRLRYLRKKFIKNWTQVDWHSNAHSINCMKEWNFLQYGRPTFLKFVVCLIFT